MTVKAHTFWRKKSAMQCLERFGSSGTKGAYPRKVEKHQSINFWLQYSDSFILAATSWGSYFSGACNPLLAGLAASRACAVPPQYLCNIAFAQELGDDVLRTGVCLSTISPFFLLLSCVYLSSVTQYSWSHQHEGDDLVLIRHIRHP